MLCPILSILTEVGGPLILAATLSLPLAKRITWNQVQPLVIVWKDAPECAAKTELCPRYARAPDGGALALAAACRRPCWRCMALPTVLVLCCSELAPCLLRWRALHGVDVETMCSQVHA